MKILNGSFYLHFYFNFKTKYLFRFQTCAIVAIVCALGGACTDLNHKPYDYSIFNTGIVPALLLIHSSGMFENSTGFIAAITNHHFYFNMLSQNFNSIKLDSADIISNKVQIYQSRCNFFIPSIESDYM